MARKPRPGQGAAHGGLPTKDEVLAFLASYQGKAGKREIARHFGIKGGDKIALKRLLGEMADEGAIAGGRKSLKRRGTLPPVAMLDITARDDQGDLVVIPVEWDDADGERPHGLLLPSKRDTSEARGALGVGDRVLARISTKAAGEGTVQFTAEPIKKLVRETRRLIGIFRKHPRGGGTVEPISRKELKSWSILAGDEGGAADGDLVRFALTRKGRFSVPQARIVESLGNPHEQQKVSLIAVHAHGIPDEFPAGVIEEAQSLVPEKLGQRTDLRHLPLVTIDPVDARDHDDAVYAEGDSDPRNPGGHVVVVAIADVAHYVQPGTRLDREAQLRGNSVYFPDRVVPMLPERISNDLCSLVEGKDRPCLAVRLVLDANGEKRSHTFVRGMMRSAAKLSYQEAQAAIDGDPSEKCRPLMATALEPLWRAYAAIRRAREKRAPLDLDLPERKVLLDTQGRVADVVVPERLDAHKLIEEMMIQANVAAAETLERANTPLVYRVHDRPSREKLVALRDFLASLDLDVPPHGQLKPASLNVVLERAKSLPVPELVNEVVLRSQAQAEYTPENIGHFGLNLARYAHFTSPIRRYADLIVHRALIRALKLGDDGIRDEDIERLAELGRSISEAERRAMAAERETIDRLIAQHLADRVGATFPARIAGVTRAGLFVRLDGTGADGFVPISTLGRDYYAHEEAAHALVGARTGETFQLGDRVTVRLVEAIPAAGALRFEVISEGKARPRSAGSRRLPPRGLRHRRGHR